MLFRFCAYGFLKNQRYFEAFLVLIFLQMGLSYFWIGVLIAIRELTVNLLEIPSGAIADAAGRRGSMIASFAAYIASFIIFAFANSWALVVTAMVLYGVGDSFRTGTHKAMIFQWLRLHGREAERTRFYGYTRSWSKIGSAVSSLLAAALVLLTDNYRAIFVFAIVPYLLNIINFLGYPKSLDGDHYRVVWPSHMLARLKRSMARAWRRPGLRRLITESMRWDGVFQAIKDYLQPVLAAWVGISLAGRLFAELSVEQRTAIAVGVTYCVLNLLGGAASRFSHQVSAAAHGEERAARWLWYLNGGIFLALAVSDLAGWLLVVAGMFVALHVLQNIWRPILVSRFDQHSKAAEGATILSIESQSQRLATLVIAPLVGWLVDLVQRDQLPGQFWPIGVIGAALALSVLARRRLA